MLQPGEVARVIIPLKGNPEMRNVADRGEVLGWEHTKWSERSLKGTQDSSWPEQNPLKPHMSFNMKKWANRDT